MYSEKRHSQGIGFTASPPLLVLRKRFKSSGGGAASAPPPIDYKALGQQQLDANLTTGAQTAGLNNVNTTGPIWSSTYEPFGTGANGIGPAGYNLKQTLTDAAQKLYNSQITTGTNASDTAQGLLPNASDAAKAGSNTIGGAFTNLAGALPTGGLDFTGLATLPTSKTDFTGLTNQAENAAYNTSARYLDPKYGQRQSDLNQQLADQGISLGSNAYDRAQGDLSRERSFDYGQASDQAVTAGQREQASLFGQDLSSRQQGVAEQEAKYTYPLTAFDQMLGAGSGLLNSGVTNVGNIGSLGNTAWATAAPSASTGYSVPATNVNASAGVAAQNAANRFTAGNTLNTSLFNGLGTLGGSSTLWGTNGLSGALGLGGNSSTGLLGGLFGGGFDAATGAGAVGPFIDASGGTGIADFLATVGPAAVAL